MLLEIAETTRMIEMIEEEMTGMIEVIEREEKELGMLKLDIQDFLSI